MGGWPQKNVAKYSLVIGLAKYTRASPSARKMSLFSSIIITIILSYAIIRIYTIWYFYFQVSKIEGLAELHWLIRLSVKRGQGSGKGHTVEKLTVPGSSSLKAQYRVSCWRNERKFCCIFPSSIKSKGKRRFLQSHRGEGDFYVENLGLFFQI